MQRAFSTSPTWSWSTGLASGTYTVRVWGGARWVIRRARRRPTPRAASLSPALRPATRRACRLPARQPVGTTIGFTAGSGGCRSNPQYQFYVQLLDGTWESTQRAFNTTPTWSWNMTALPPGTYTVVVWANQVGDSTSSPEAYASSSVTLTTGPPPCTSANLSPSSTSQPAGTTISFTAGSVGCPNPQYQFFVQQPNGTWTMQRGIQHNPSWSWSTTGLAPGTPYSRVWGQPGGQLTSSREAYASSTVTLTSATACTSASLSPAGTSRPVGTTIGFTAGSGGCPNPQYQFFVQLLDGTWSMQRAFSISPTWNWSTTGPPGTYTVRVWATRLVIRRAHRGLCLEKLHPLHRASGLHLGEPVATPQHVPAGWDDGQLRRRLGRLPQPSVPFLRPAAERDVEHTAGDSAPPPT